MAKKTKKDGEYYTPYPLQYPFDDAELRCLHIKREDVEWLGTTVRRPYLMVRCDNPDKAKNCTRLFNNDRKAENRYWRCPAKGDNGKCKGKKCSDCSEPYKGTFIPVSYFNKETSDFFVDREEGRRIEDKIDLDIVISKVEKKNPNYARYLRKSRKMKTHELELSEGKSHSTVIEGRNLAIKLAIKIYNGEE